MKYNFSVDWFSHNIPVWEEFLAEFKGKPITAIELGAYEGRASIWLLENILTHPKARLMCVDTWEGSAEHQEVDMKAVKKRFKQNVKGRKVSIWEQTTTGFLSLHHGHTEADLIYIDASHKASDVLSDAVLSDKLLKPGGILIFDDYLWGDGSINTPKPAIDAFLMCYAGQYAILHKQYQVILKKL